MFEVRWRTASFSLIYKWPWYLIACFYALKHHLFERKRLIRAEISAGGFDIVTVVFKEELAVLRLQARSLARFLDPSFSGTIIVIVNDLDLPGTVRKIRRWVLPEYGSWQDRVRIVPFHHLGSGLDPWNGWIFQQPLKLAVSGLIDKPFYVVLDAKNHAVKALPTEKFVSLDGRGLQKLGDVPISLPRHYDACARYFDLDPASSPAMPCLPVTPFVMHTQTARDLIDHIEAREGRSLFAFFCRTRFLSEFLLYGFYLRVHKASEIDLIYEQGPILSQTVWRDGMQIKHAIENVEMDPKSLFFAVHRGALKQLKAGERTLVENFWRQSGLLVPGETLRQLEQEMQRLFTRRIRVHENGLRFMAKPQND
jgi:hypothetical protein